MQGRSGGWWLGAMTAAVLVAGCGHDRFVPGRACAPGDTRPCYNGAPKTQGIGPCKGGLETCLADASGWGLCEGEVTPETERCGNDVDDDCDGVVNESGEGCLCVPGQEAACYDGPEGTAGAGICKAGTQTCQSDGTYGACDGEVLPAAEDCDAPADEDCDGIVCSAPIWGQLFGDAAASQEARALAVGPDGDLFVAFDFEGTLHLGAQTLTSAGAHDVAVARLAPDGSVVWAAGFGAELDELTGGLAVGADGNPVLVATFYSAQLTVAGSDLLNDGDGADAFLVKLGAATGAPLWVRRIGQSGSFTPGGVAVAPSADANQPGDVVVAGTFQGTLVCLGPSCVNGQIQSSSVEAFVQRVAGDGLTLRWTKTVGGPGADAANAVAVGADGSVFAGGKVSQDAKLDMITLTPAGNSDAQAFLAKLSKDGEPLWAHAYGDLGAQTILGVAVSTGGDVVAGGASQGAIDFAGGVALPLKPSQAFVVKLSKGGAALWARGYPAPFLTYVAGVAFDAAGNVLATGPFQTTVDFGGKTPLVAGQTDAFLLKLDAAGAYRWVRAFGASDKNDRGAAVTATAEGEVLFAGSFGGAVTFGLEPLMSAGQIDAGVALFQP